MLSGWTNPAKQREIVVQGFLPLVDAGCPATVKISGQNVPLRKMTRNRFCFDLPDMRLEKDSVIPLVFHLPLKQGWFGRVKYEDQEDLLKVMNPTPFTFVISAHRDNEAALEKITPQTPFKDEANTYNGHHVPTVHAAKTA